MEYFLVRYDSRVVIYERKMFIRLATGLVLGLRPDLNQKCTKEVNELSVQNKKNNSSNY